MSNFGTIYGYEVKKILGRRLVWAVTAVCMLCVVLFTFADLTGKYYVDGAVADTHYHMFQVDQEYRHALSGRALDQKLLAEVSKAYRTIPDTSERYTLTPEYETYARPYSEIFHLVRRWTQGNFDEFREWEPDERALYAARGETLEQIWRDLQLTDAEKAYWRGKEAETKTPLVYFYHEGYSKILSNGLNTISILILLAVCICMAGVFAEEHARRTDQLILSGAKGKSMVYWAKIAAGVSVSSALALALSALVFGLVFAVYGAEGFAVSLRFSSYLWNSSEPISIGQACLTAYGIVLVTTAVVSALMLVLSEVLHNSIAALAVGVGAIMAGMLARIPQQYRVAAQIWDWSPVRFLNAEYIFDSRTIPLAEHCLSAWQVVPVLYILAGIGVVVAGKFIYQRYQVSGR